MRKVFAVLLTLGMYSVAQEAKVAQKTTNANGQHSAIGATPAIGHTGRYQLFFSPHARADVYLVDTETGRIWKPITVTNVAGDFFQSESPQIWVYQQRIDDGVEFKVWSDLHPVTSPTSSNKENH